jgi:hypothetical protein
MDQNVLKINILAIVGFGLLVTLIGVGLYLFRESISENIRFLLPIPPLGVAAYVFVFNVFRYYGDQMPVEVGVLTREILLGTGAAALVFGGMVFFLVYLLEYSRRFL